MISIIVAASNRGVIGKDGGMPWKLPADMRRFKQLTMGHALIMGRKTYESIGRPLPGRRMIVMTRQATAIEGVFVVDSFEAAIDAAGGVVAGETAVADGNDEIFVAGGAEIYGLAWLHAKRIYLTRVEGAIAGDTVLSALHGDPTGFVRVGTPEMMESTGSSHKATFSVWERK